MVPFPPPRVMLPPLLEMEEPAFIRMAPAPLASESELSTTAPPCVVSAVVPPKVMSPVAFRVRLLVLLMLPLALMLPALAVNAAGPFTVQAPGSKFPLAWVMERPV